MPSQRKKYLFLLLFVVTIGGYLSSCSSKPFGGGQDIIWDFTSSELAFELVDEKGNPLIEPYTPAGDARLKSLVMHMQGREFRYRGLPERELRAMPEFYRTLEVKRDKGSFLLTFGEFQPHYKRERLTLVIPGVDTYEIVFTNHVVTRGRQAFRTELLWINGTLQNQQNNPLRGRIVIDRAKWDAYSATEEGKVAQGDHLPVTIYFFGKRMFTQEPTASRLVYRSKSYELIAEEQLEGDPIWQNEPHFYKGLHNTSVLGRASDGVPYYAFGPFDPAKGFHNEILELQLSEGIRAKVSFSAWIDQEGKVVYEATRLDEKNNPIDEKKLYFRNGPMIYL